MAYTFRIHKGTPAQEDGWQPSEELVGGSDSKTGLGSIDDSIDGGNAGKVGTSIPTPFARVYLFETAFSFVSLNKRSKDYNFYDQLVTQALDLLQLVFEKGKDPKLKIYEWNGEAQINELFRKKFKKGHETLARSFKMAITTAQCLRTINLIEYDGVVLGGTSPYTLTYTSPNAVRQLREKDIELFANDKSQLFKDRGIKHLRERSHEFQRYVYWLVFKKNIADFDRDGTPLKAFYNYVKSQNINISEEELSGIPESYFEPVRRRSEINSADVTLSVLGNVSLRVNAEPMNMKESDFYMRPSVHCFGNGPVPIILPTDGDSSYDGWQYTKNDTWQSFTTVDYWNLKTSIDSRCLPTNGAHNQFTTNQYPWLTTGDFFETSLVLLGYDLNTAKFYFPNTGNTAPQFLLPIKREYFKYYTLNDLIGNLKCTVQKDTRDESRISEVSFELRLKLQNRENIVLRRTYRAAYSGETPDFPIVELSEGMSFGVFPFFRCPEEYDKKNEYAVYLYGSSTDTDSAKLSFFKQDFSKNMLKAILDSDTDGRGEGVIRTKTSDSGFSKIYNLRTGTSNSFDLIEVNLSDKKNACRGLAIPLWSKLPVMDTNKEAIVSIDFGTSNTYVSYLENGEAKPLTIGLEDQQMVLLNGSSVKHGTNKAQYRVQENFGDNAHYMSQYLREFVPSIIGHREEIADDEFIEFPIKTATIEKQNFKAEDSLFTGISIGFNIDNEKNAVEADRFRYVTNLKWSAEEHKGKQDQDNNLAEFNKDKSRIQAFCDQILWMIKNKLIMKGFSSSVKMMYFYPDSMSEVGRDIFKESWENAVKSILSDRGYEVSLKEELEAISPYYSLLTLNGNKVYSKSTANIDVGGGTTDYFILDLDPSHTKLDNDGAESGKAYEASIFFAGNDLWGATYPESTNHGKYQYNGFVEYMKSKVQDCPQAARTLYNCYDKDKGMADFSGFFFKNDQLFGFSEKISSNEKFKFVVFLHYAAIIYHFTDILKRIKKEDPDFKYPEILTFTGKGSEYVQMLSKQSGPISEITTQLIRAFGLEDFRGIEVIRVENPKALTADGGIYELMSNSALRINLFDKDEFGATKSNTVTNTPYVRIGKLCLGLEGDKVDYTRGDVVNVKSSAMEHVRKFADAVYHSPILATTRNFLKVNLSEDDYKIFLKYAEDSYDTHASRFLKNNIKTSERPLDENVFFFAMKNTLINLSKYYYDKSRK